MLKHFLALISLVSVTQLAVWAVAATAEPANPLAKTLKIGVILPLSGSLVASGAAVRNSIELADELYDSGNLVQFIFEDDGFLPKNSVSIARKFISDKVDAVIIFGTPTALAVAPVTEQAQLPLAAISILDRVVADRNYTVRHFVGWQAENQRVVAEVKKRGYQKVALVTSSNDASLALRDGFMREAGVTIVLNEEFSREEMDFQTVATKIKGLKADAVYHLLFAPQGSAFMKALRRVGCDLPVFAAHNVEDPQEVAAAQGTYEGIWYVTGNDRAGKFYLEAYRKKYGAGPAMGGANGFDYAKMLIEADQKGIPVLKQLKELCDFEGAFGRYGAAAGNTFDLTATLRVIRDGQFADSD